jgi:hypothetical protein
MRIAHIVLNNFTRDSRVQKFAATAGLAHDYTSLLYLGVAKAVTLHRDCFGHSPYA